MQKNYIENGSIIYLDIILDPDTSNFSSCKKSLLES